MNVLRAFTDYVDNQIPTLRHFRPKEFLIFGEGHRAGPGKGLNTWPPVTPWENIIPTIRALDEIRERVGLPITTLSVYRSPAYNAAIGGAIASYHMQFRAVDFYCGEKGEAWTIANDLRSEGFFSGGLGLYRGFIHIDTRGFNATW